MASAPARAEQVVQVSNRGVRLTCWALVATLGIGVVIPVEAVWSTPASMRITPALVAGMTLALLGGCVALGYLALRLCDFSTAPGFVQLPWTRAPISAKGWFPSGNCASSRS